MSDAYCEPVDPTRAPAKPAANATATPATAISPAMGPHGHLVQESGSGLF